MRRFRRLLKFLVVVPLALVATSLFAVLNVLTKHKDRDGL